MNELTHLPNIGKNLADLLVRAGINNEQELKDLGSENALIKIAALGNGDACLSKLYALEGAVQGIRWHDLDKIRKQELKEFYNLFEK